MLRIRTLLTHKQVIKNCIQNLSWVHNLYAKSDDLSWSEILTEVSFRVLRYQSF